MMTPAPRFANDDEAAQHWLAQLRDGSRIQKIHAREHLAAIFERRGMFEEAVELLESNAAAGVRTPDLYDRLYRLYQSQGNAGLSLNAHAEAKKLRATEARLTVDLASERRESTLGISRGILYIVLGLTVTVGTFLIASNAGGGRYIILYGPVLFGGYLLLRGLADMFPRDLGK